MFHNVQLLGGKLANTIPPKRLVGTYLVFIVRVKCMLKVQKCELRVVGLFSFNHDFHLTSMFRHKLGSLLNHSIQLCSFGLKSYQNFNHTENQFQ